MQFISDLFLTVIIAYLSITNYLADSILALMPEPYSVPLAEEIPLPEDSLTALPSQFDKKIIPTLLRNSLPFQQAAVSEAGVTSAYVTDPIKALVNIYCTFTTEKFIRTTTGTGFFVHSDGVILTNAHVAQFLLLGNTDLLGEAECIIRQGNPAAVAYHADLLYIPPAWVQENASVIDDAIPTGTGERDYALLYVQESLSGEPLPALFPALKADTELLPLTIRGSTVTAAGYPATDFIKNGVSTPLIPERADTTVSELYTFGSNYADVFSIHGSQVGAEGSSGGPVVNESGQVIGMIVTRGNDLTDGAGSLRAISLSHIHRTMLEETGFTFERNVSGNLARRSEVFMDTLAPFLLTLLQVELTN